MAIEINNNLHPKIKEPLDNRLKTVDNVASLPDPNLNTNFIHEGAIIHVRDVRLNYQAQIPTTLGLPLIWVNIGGAAPVTKVQGTINILPNTNILDCNSVSPAIANCHSVLVKIVGGNSATITSVKDLPAVADEDDLITFYIETGKTLTFTHTDYDAAGTDDIILEDGFDMTLTGRLIGNESLTLKKHDAAVAQWDATQFLRKGDLTTQFLNLFTVENSLTSISTTKALSAFQGKILDDKISLKQDKLTADDHISIFGTSPNTKIKALPWQWEKQTTLIPKSATPSTYLPGTYGTLSDKYRWVDMGATKGTWVLPPYVDPTSFANWFEFNRPVDTLKTVRYQFVSDTSFTAVGTNYNPRINTAAQEGDDIISAWNADGPTTEKVCFTLPTGTYKVKVKLNINSDRHNDLIFNMYSINGPTTAAVGVPGTNVLKDVAFTSSPTTVWTDADQDSYEVEALIIVGGTAGVGDGLIFGLTSTSGFASTSSYSAAPGYVDITKLK